MRERAAVMIRPYTDQLRSAADALTGWASTACAVWPCGLDSLSPSSASPAADLLACVVHGHVCDRLGIPS